LELTHHASAATKQITHLRFCSWPDYGIADLSTLKALISMVERHRSSASVEELPIVHCSAGCGRTGTFIAMSVLQENPSTPIPQLVESLRRQRISMVQSFSQFELLHQFQALCKAEP
jgi:protein tyrosine phosphatase